MSFAVQEFTWNYTRTSPSSSEGAERPTSASFDSTVPSVQFTIDSAVTPDAIPSIGQGKNAVGLRLCGVPIKTRDRKASPTFIGTVPRDSEFINVADPVPSTKERTVKTSDGFFRYKIYRESGTPGSWRSSSWQKIDDMHFSE